MVYKEGKWERGETNSLKGYWRTTLIDSRWGLITTKIGWRGIREDEVEEESR